MTITNSQIPLYIQIKNSIKEKITSKEYPIGTKIPTEPEVEAQYSVSRVTVRKAIKELVAEGYLVKQQGKGTFVNHKTVKRKMSYVMGYSKSCLTNGLTPSSVVLDKKIIFPTEEIAKKLEVSVNDKVIYIRRKRLADGVPIFLENNYFAYKDYHFLMEENLNDSLYEILEKRGIRPEHSGTRTLELALANDEISHIMSLPIGTPFFFLDVVILDQNNKPIHVGHQYYLADYYKFDM